MKHVRVRFVRALRRIALLNHPEVGQKSALLISMVPKWNGDRILLCGEG